MTSQGYLVERHARPRILFIGHGQREKSRREVRRPDLPENETKMRLSLLGQGGN
jgi:hypothetical protein